MSVQNYNELSEHFGHPIEIAMYGVDTNLAIECVDCNEVLLDFDNNETTTTDEQITEMKYGVDTALLLINADEHPAIARYLSDASDFFRNYNER